MEQFCSHVSKYTWTLWKTRVFEWQYVNHLKKTDDDDDDDEEDEEVEESNGFFFDWIS